MVKANHALSNSAQNVKSILRNSNRKCDLQNLAFFFQVCIQRCISLEVKCIPRAWSWTVSADCISKHFCFDDNDFWGPHTIDRFACSYNAQLPRFNYSILSARLRGSFFYQSWGYDNNNWLCPRVCLTVRVIRPLFSPYGSQLFFWNAFTRDGVLWNGFVVNWLYLPNFQGLFVPAWSAIPFSNPGSSNQFLPPPRWASALRLPQSFTCVLLVAFYAYTFRSEAVRFFACSLLLIAIFAVVYVTLFFPLYLGVPFSWFLSLHLLFFFLCS